MNEKELQVMKCQLAQMEDIKKRSPEKIAGGYVGAGFGGDFNGINVPPTFMQGRLPNGVSPMQAFEQVMAFMRETIAQAEREQKTKCIASSDSLVRRIR
ncbi:MAG: hypothetical protein K5751_03180 [Treponemataceae bacterium]|nr:hypothetical protein [Treponemataceae bacterium]